MIQSFRAISLSVLVALTTTAVCAADLDDLQEVVVTASLRRSADLEVAASTTVLDAKTLQRAGVQHLQDVLSLVPNLNWASGTSRPRYFQLRGIGETDQWQGAPNPSVGFLIDGMDFSGVGMPATLIDVAQVEVLHGPQGTTLGANALAGLINVVTESPDAAPTLRLQVEGGEANTRSFGMVAGDGAEWRVVAQKFRSDGFRDNVFLRRSDTNGLDESTLRARWRYLPAERWRIDVATLWVEQNNGFDAFSIDNSRITQSDQPGRDRQRSRGLSVTVDHDGEPFDLRSTTALTDADIVYSFDGDWGHDRSYDFTSRFFRRHRTLSQDFRVLSQQTEALRWLAGVYALRMTESNDQLDLYDGDIYRALTSRYRAETTAAYTDLEWTFASQWTLQGGGRIERRATRYDDSDDTAVAPAETMRGGNLSLSYAPAASERFYLAVARGYKGGGFNIGAVVPAAKRRFDAELLNSVELGWKSFDPSRTWRAEVSLFHMRRSRQQVSTSVQVDPGDPLSFIYLTDNAARGENYGLEGALRVAIDERWTFGTTLGLLRARFLDYRNGARNLAGRDQAHAPRLQAGFDVEYRHPVGYFARLDAQQQAAFYFSDSHDQRAVARTLVNARIGWAQDRWEASLWARNLLDRTYAQRGFFFGNEPPDYPDKLYVQQADPRQIGVSVRVELR